MTFDDELVEIPTDVLKLYQHLKIRKRSREFVEPLTMKGVDHVEIVDDQDVTVRLDRHDVTAFDVPDKPLETFDEQIVEQRLEISNIAFPAGHKWKFNDGESTFHAKIEDEAFLGNVESRVEAFRSGDMLRARVAMRQTRRTTGLYTERAIVEVLEHIRAQVQLPLHDAAPE